MAPLAAVDEDAPLVTPDPQSFDVVKHFGTLLERDDPMPAPVAAVEALAELVSRSDSSTIQELLALLRQASAQIAASSFNPVSAQSGTSLFLRFLTLQRPPPEMSFREFKAELVSRAREFVRDSGKCRATIAAHMSNFIQDGNTLLVHSYSRVVIQALLYAAQTQKKRFQVYVTESRPFGLGLKTHAVLTEAGIPCIVVLDSAVAYIMSKCDLAVVGAEAVCESGGLVNFIGGYQMSIAAKAMGKPFYALAESFNPLSQYDIPSSLPSAPLAFPAFDDPVSTSSTGVPPTPVRPMIHSKMPEPLEMSDEATRHNPILDYTTPDHITLIVSDIGVMTPSGVSDALLAVYAE
ncbi:translation initiation factor eIF-2B alpha subunit [Rhodotorula toruloides]|uniref:Translation initiation factor eIF2B subunit alpha n=1 Tax=Rhodotorula toruloides TaxID=5286 RepID=A0A511KMU4_RHOTO|nr:translation initiation factor eIF-2B alpha subunit [Rhodotorula toruloides]